jgi:hypothetical protein
VILIGDDATNGIPRSPTNTARARSGLVWLEDDTLLLSAGERRELQQRPIRGKRAETNYTPGASTKESSHIVGERRRVSGPAGSNSLNGKILRIDPFTRERQSRGKNPFTTIPPAPGPRCRSQRSSRSACATPIRFTLCARSSGSHDPADGNPARSTSAASAGNSAESMHILRQARAEHQVGPAVRVVCSQQALRRRPPPTGPPNTTEPARQEPARQSTRLQAKTSRYLPASATLIVQASLNPPSWPNPLQTRRSRFRTPGPTRAPERSWAIHKFHALGSSDSRGRTQRRGWATFDGLREPRLRGTMGNAAVSGSDGNDFPGNTSTGRASGTPAPDLPGGMAEHLTCHGGLAARVVYRGG